MAPYFKTILVRCMREDRVVPAMNELIRNMEALTTIPGDESGTPMWCLGGREGGAWRGLSRLKAWGEGKSVGVW